MVQEQQQRQQEQQLTTLQESQELAIITLPLFVESAAYVGQQLVASSFVGHLAGPMPLSAYVLAQSVSNISGYSIVSGLTSALETFAGQAFGAGNYHMLGVLLVRAQLVCLLAISPIVLLWASGVLAKLLPLLGQAAVISGPSSRLLQLMVPSLLLSVVSETVSKYLVSQSAALPGMACHLVGLGLSPFFFGGLINGAGLGVAGAAIGALAVEVVLLLLQLGYLGYRDTTWLASYGGGTSIANWRGFTLAEVMQGWGTYLGYGLPIVAMVCLEWWASEALVLMAGLLPDAEVAVAVMGLSFQAALLPWMFCASLGTATTTRVGQALGAGSATQARGIFRLACWAMLGLSVCLAAGVLLLKGAIASAFTADAATQQQLQAVMPVVVAGIICDGQVSVLNGLLCAAGRQGLGAAITTATYLLIAIPAGWLLGFKARLGVLGLRSALTAAVTLQTVVLHGLVIWWLDWQGEVGRAKQRVDEGERQQAGDGQDRQQHEVVELTAVGTKQAVDEPEAESAPLLLHTKQSCDV